jgi:hypothetical protein
VRTRFLCRCDPIFLSRTRSTSAAKNVSGSRGPLQTLSGVIEHRVKHAIAFLCEKHPIVTVQEMHMQHIFHRRSHAAFRLRVAEPVLHENFGRFLALAMQQ